MTWDEMSHEEARLKSFITTTKKRPKKNLIGFVLSGKTYDGDGNLQWDAGTDMSIIFKNKAEFKNFAKKLKKVI